eukprot:6213279-Pleurochrysis_carterae.AAC.2
MSHSSTEGGASRIEVEHGHGGARGREVIAHRLLEVAVHLLDELHGVALAVSIRADDDVALVCQR